MIKTILRTPKNILGIMLGVYVLVLHLGATVMVSKLIFQDKYAKNMKNTTSPNPYVNTMMCRGNLNHRTSH